MYFYLITMGNPSGNFLFVPTPAIVNKTSDHLTSLFWFAIVILNII